MKISLVIPAKNEEQLIARCLQSVLDQTQKPHEVIVVDNASTDTTRLVAESYVEQFKKRDISLVILSCIHGSQIEARGMAFRTAKHEIIGTIDADTILESTWCAEVVNCFESNPKIVGMGGSISYNDPVVAFLHGAVFTWYRIFPRNYFFYGCNGAFRRSAYHQIPRVEECRALMEQYRLHEPYEDVFVSMQLKKIGLVVQWPGARVSALARMAGGKGSLVDVIRRSYTQLRESLFLQKLLKP